MCLCMQSLVVALGCSIVVLMAEMWLYIIKNPTFDLEPKSPPSHHTTIPGLEFNSKEVAAKKKKSKKPKRRKEKTM